MVSKRLQRGRESSPGRTQSDGLGPGRLAETVPGEGSISVLMTIRLTRTCGKHFDRS